MPQLLHEIDDVFAGLFAWWMFPVTAKILQFSPFKGIRDFLSAPRRFKKVRTVQRFLFASISSCHVC